MPIDLHCHSRASDGSFSLAQLLATAKERGLSHLGITDHDRVDHLPDAVLLGPQYGVKVIPGVELSAFDHRRGRKVHILGYFPASAFGNIDSRHDDTNREKQSGLKHTRDLCEPLLAERHKNTLRQLAVLKGLGFPLDEPSVAEEAGESTVWYKQHLMAVLIRNGAADGQYGAVYKRLFKGEGPCAESIEYFPAVEAVRAVKADGGIAILAHPGLTDSWDLVPDLAKAGLDGIEEDHPSHDPSDRHRVKALADRYGFVRSGGSDFHGVYGDEPELGTHVCPDEYESFFAGIAGLVG